MTDCVIEAGTVLEDRGTDGRMIEQSDAAILVKAGRVAQIAPRQDLARSHPGLPRHGGPGAIAISGLVNSHHHFGITPLMNGVAFAPLEFWLPRFRGMRSTGDRLDTLFSAIEMLESGTTAVHHIHGGLTGDTSDWQATAERVLGAYAECCMRAGFSFMIRDRHLLGYEDDAEFVAGLPADLRDWIAPQLAPSKVPTRDYMAFFRDLWERHAANDSLRLNLAPANLHWCSDDSLRTIFETARDTGA